MSDIAIRAENISKRYRIGHLQSQNQTLTESILSAFKRRSGKSAGKSGDDHIWALKDVSFEVKRGEVVGIIGRNGSGKSTLLKILSRITKPTEGRAEIHGRVATLLEVGTGFHPELTGRENTYLSGAVLGMRKAEIDRKFEEIVAFAEIEKFIDTPVKHYSSGMYVRLAFAVAAHLEPEILLVDEVLAVGDIAFQKKCLGKMREVGYSGKTVLVVSHNMQTIAALCKRAIWLNSGICVGDGSADQVLGEYEHNPSLSLSRDDGRIIRSSGSRGRAWFDWLEVKDDSGAPRTIFENGEYLNLAMSISGDLPPASYFEWALVTERGQTATSGGTFMKKDDISLPTPSGMLRTRIGPLPLAEGRYFLHLRLGVQPGYEMLELWEEATSILISNCVPEAGGLPFDTRRGIIYVPADYSADG